jgi:hypothetical protein
MMKLTRRRPIFRSKIELRGSSDVRCWTKALGVAPSDLKRTIAKVGNSAAAVRKEIERTAAKF